MQILWLPAWFLQLFPPLARLPHRFDQQTAEDREQEARHDFQYDPEQPEVKDLVEVTYEIVITEPVTAAFQPLRAVENVVGQAEDDCDHEDSGYGLLGPTHVAEAWSEQMVAYDDVPEEGKGDREPHGYGVGGYDEIRVEKEIEDPAYEKKHVVIIYSRVSIWINYQASK